ncbi:MAG: GAF domain-containing protein [Nitrospirae bacterium]|nr:GAF domain-containing protein [Nitrospirota bacterium]
MKIGINRKIISAFFAVLLLYVMVVGAVFLVINDIYKLNRELDVNIRKERLTGDLQIRVNKLLAPVNGYLLTGDAKERDKFDLLINKTSRIFKELKDFKENKEWDLLVERVAGEAINFGNAAVEILFIEHPVGNKKANGLMTALNLKADALTKEVDQFHNLAEADVEKMRAVVEKKIQSIQTVSMIILGLMLLSVVPLSFYIKRFVTGPLQKLYDGAKIFGSGRLDHRVFIKTGDEIEELAEGFNLMAASLDHSKRELERRIRELFTLYNVSRIISTTFEAEELLKEIVVKISSSLDIQRVVVMLLDDKREDLYIASFTDFSDSEIRNIRYKVGEGLYGGVAASGKARLVADLNQCGDVIQKDKWSPNIKSVIAVPFHSRKAMTGLICAFKDKPGVFNQEDLELMTTVAQQVGIALENIKLYQKTKMMAITDGLTGLYNHRFFIKRLGERTELESCHCEQSEAISRLYDKIATHPSVLAMT